MAMPKLVFNNEEPHFIDITNDDVRIKFADTEVIEGHIFKHVEYGIFAAVPAFEIDNADMLDMIINYRDVVYVVEELNEAKKKDDRRYKVILAYSIESSGDFWKLNYINNLENRDSKLWDYYEFMKRLEPVEYGYYRTEKLNREELPDNKSALAPLYTRVILPDGRKPWIKLNKHIGIEVEAGIYYFPKSGESIGYCLSNMPVVDLNTAFADENVAAICHSTDIHFSFDTAVEYLAIGKEHFPRLKEIQRLLSNTGYGYYHEFRVQKSNQCENNTAENQGILSMDDIRSVIDEVSNSNSKSEVIISSDAEELVEGLGFYKLCVRYERPFFEPVGFRDYDVAYKLKDKLVLGNKKNDEIIYEYHELRFLSGLYVKKDARLNNGIDYPVIHAVIDCREERLKQVLTKEAYSLYVNELSASTNK